MKIQCACGELIYDIMDSQPNKARIIPDQEWLEFADKIDAVARGSSPQSVRKEEFVTLWKALGEAIRLAWQCDKCGRIYVDDQQFKAQGFQPDDLNASREIFRSRPSSNR